MASETNVNDSVITLNMEIKFGVPKIVFVMLLTIGVSATEEFYLFQVS